MEPGRGRASPYKSSNNPMTDSIALPFERRVLSNGLTLLMHRDPKVPQVAVNVWYKVGSRNERAGKTGLAHLFEHLMFEGSLHHDDEYFAPLEDVGATQINATTSRDRTNYFQTVPVHALDLALWLESDRMGFFLDALTEEKLEEQRSVVLNEMRQGYNQPYGKLWKVIAESTYPDGHPYSWPVIGQQEDVEAFTLEDAREWFSTWYGPDNAVLTLAGDIDFDDATTRVERYFGDIPAGKPIVESGSWTAERTETRTVRMQDRVPQARLALVWNLPAITDPDYLPLYYLAGVLSSGRSSALFRRLVHRDELVTDISASMRPGYLASNLVIQADARPGVELDAICSTLEDELARVVEEGPDPAQLERSQTQVRAGLLRQLQRVGGLSGKANVLASGEAYYQQPDVVLDQLRDGMALTPADLDRVMQRWLMHSGGGLRGVLRLDVEPFTDLAPRSTDVNLDRSSPPSLPDPSSASPPLVEQVRLENGDRLLHLYRPHLPLVRLEVNLPGGFATDLTSIPGTARFTAEALAEGTRQRDAFAISDAIRSQGATLSVHASLDSTTLSMTALEENLDETLSLASELVAEAAFPEPEIERLREELRAEIAQEEASPGHLAQRLLPHLLYGEGHTYATSFTGAGSTEELDQIQRQTLDRHRLDWYLGARARIACAGSVAVEEITQRLEAVLTTWPGGELSELEIDAQAKPQPGIHFIERPGSEQALLFAGILAPAIDIRTAPALDIFNSAFGGAFTSRINTNLREDKAWTYGAHSTLVQTRAQRPFLIYTEVDQEHTLEAIGELERETNEVLSTRPIDERELERARDNLLLSLPARWETLAGSTRVLSDLLVLDQPVETLEAYAAGLQAASTENVAAAIEPWFDYERVVWVVVGDRKVGRAIEKKRDLRGWTSPSAG